MDKNSENRKYSIIDEKTKAYIDEMKNGNGLCFKKFKYDFVTDINISDLKVGDSICIEGIDMIVTKIGKGCYPNECELYKKILRPCELKNNVIFAK